MYRILIVEDDGAIAGAVKRHVETWGFEVHTVSDFQNVLTEFTRYDPQLVLLDIALPFFSGYHWCGEIRKLSKVPIIFLSSASDKMNIVMAIGMGADDFIAKPFDLTVLTAKIQAVMRRAYDFSVRSEIIEHKGAMLNVADATLHYNGLKIDLTKNEFRIVLTLMENRGRVVERDALMQRLWETDSFVDENTLSVNVARLRRKLEAAGLNGFIETKKGMGYLVD
jgi:two-component system, OmpR family, response regulator protein BraR/BceR